MVYTRSNGQGPGPGTRTLRKSARVVRSQPLGHTISKPLKNWVWNPSPIFDTKNNNNYQKWSQNEVPNPSPRPPNRAPEIDVQQDASKLGFGSEKPPPMGPKTKVRWGHGGPRFAINLPKPDVSGIMLPAKDSRQITSAKCYRLSKTSLRARTSRLENVTERIGVLGYAINQAKHNFEK